MRRRKKTSGKVESLGNVLQDVLAKQKINVSSGNRKLIDVWKKSVGPQIASRTRPDRVQKGILYVKVANSVWMHQLQFLKRDIMDKFNKNTHTETVENIRFFLGEIRGSQSLEERTFDFSAYPLNARDRNIIEKSTETVEDEELKNLLKSVMQKEIIRRRILEKKRGR